MNGWGFLAAFCDVLSTLQRIKYHNEETNPLARQMMIRVGTTKAVWIIFILALIIISIATTMAVLGGCLMQIFFMIVGVAISIIQVSVAHCNWSGRDNTIAKMILALHNQYFSIFYQNRSKQKN